MVVNKTTVTGEGITPLVVELEKLNAKAQRINAMLGRLNCLAERMINASRPEGEVYQDGSLFAVIAKGQVSPRYYTTRAGAQAYVDWANSGKPWADYIADVSGEGK